jgi:hypothetical protein
LDEHDAKKPQPPARRIRFKGRPLKRHPFDPPQDEPKTWSERELEELKSLDLEDRPPDLGAEGMREGCMGCMWVMLLFFILLAGAVVLNCVKL